MTQVPERPRNCIPLWLKIFCTIFVLVLIPTYWRSYGPANFLSFCDVGLILTCIGLWLESPLLISINAVALMLPQTIWICDFVSHGNILGITGYMFNKDLPLLTRTLSTFHIWLPVVLIVLVWRMGYDRRALWMQSTILALLLIASYILTDPRHPPAGYPIPAVNLNRVYGFSDTGVQTRMPALLYIATEYAFFVVCMYLLTHLILQRTCKNCSQVGAIDKTRLVAHE